MFTYNIEFPDCRVRNQCEILHSHLRRKREMDLCMSGVESSLLRLLGLCLCMILSMGTMQSSPTIHRQCLYKNKQIHYFLIDYFNLSNSVISVASLKYLSLRTSNKLLFANKVPFFFTRGIIPFVMPSMTGVGMDLNAILVASLVIWLTCVPIIKIEQTSVYPLKTILIPLASNPSCMDRCWILQASNKRDLFCGMDGCQLSIFLLTGASGLIPILFRGKKFVASSFEHGPSVFAPTLNIVARG